MGNVFVIYFNESPRWATLFYLFVMNIIDGLIEFIILYGLLNGSLVGELFDRLLRWVTLLMGYILDGLLSRWTLVYMGYIFVIYMNEPTGSVYYF